MYIQSTYLDRHTCTASSITDDELDSLDFLQPRSLRHRRYLFDIIHRDCLDEVHRMWRTSVVCLSGGKKCKRHWFLLSLDFLPVLSSPVSVCSRRYDSHQYCCCCRQREREIDRRTILVCSDILLLLLETYPPQVLIKTRLDLAIRSREYSLQCYSRGNPLPRLLWSKEIDSNQTLEYFPSAKQCKTPCRIYTTQNRFVRELSSSLIRRQKHLRIFFLLRYQSTLFFQPLILDDIGTYVCRKTRMTVFSLLRSSSSRLSL